MNKHFFERNGNLDLPKMLTSTAIGGIVGLAAGLLLTAKAREKRGNFYRTCHAIADKAEDFRDDLLRKGGRMVDKASDYAENVKERAGKYMEECSHLATNPKIMALGLISGIVIGGSSLLLMKVLENKEEGVYETIRNKTATILSPRWIETAHQLLQIIDTNIKEGVGHKAGKFHNAAQDAVELALQGIKVWRNLNFRR